MSFRRGSAPANLQHYLASTTRTRSVWPPPTSEIARNAFRYARNGEVRFSVELESPQRVEILVSDSGPGISNLEDILDGRYKSDTGMGMGILGTKRLMDEFECHPTSERHHAPAWRNGFPGTACRLTPRARPRTCRRDCDAQGARQSLRGDRAPEPGAAEDAAGAAARQEEN